MIQKCIRLALFTLICVLIAVGAWTVIFLDTLTRTTAELPVVANQAIAREGILTRSMLSQHVGNALKSANRQIAGLRKDVRKMEKDVRKGAERQISGGLEKLDAQLTTLNGTIDKRLSDVTVPAGKAVTDLSAPAKNVLNVASENADLLGDCDHNPSCFANRTIGTMKAIEKTSQSVQKAADAVEKVTPDTAAAVKSTSADLSVIVSRFAKPASFIKNAASTAASIIGKFLGF